MNQATEAQRRMLENPFFLNKAIEEDQASYQQRGGCS